MLKYITLSLLFFTSACSVATIVGTPMENREEIKVEEQQTQEQLTLLQDYNIIDINSLSLNPEYMLHYQYGVSLALTEINSSGGVNGRNLKINYKEDYSSFNEAYLKAQQAFVKEKALLIMGTHTTSTALGLAKYAQDTGKVVFITGSSTEEIYNQDIINNSTFRLPSGNNTHVAALLNEMHQDNTQSVLIIANQSTEGNNIKNFIEEQNASKGYNIEINKDIRIGSTINERTLSEAVYASPAESVLIVVNKNQIERVVKILQDNKVVLNKKVYIAHAGEPEWLDVIGVDTPKGWKSTGIPWYSINTTENLDFYRNYVKSFKFKPRISSYLGYISVYMVADVLERANIQYLEDPENDKKIREAFASIDINTPFSNIRMRKDNRSNLGFYLGTLNPYDRERKQSNKTVVIKDIRMFGSEKVNAETYLPNEEQSYKDMQSYIQHNENKEEEVE